MDKDKLKQVLNSLQNPEENEQDKIDALTENIASLASSIKDMKETSNQSLSDGLKAIQTALEALYKKPAPKFDTQTILEGLKELGTNITTSYVKNKPENTAPVYKDMINSISSVKKSIDDKRMPVWNWPQYASVGVRNRSFSNIDPAVDSMNIGEYDWVGMTLDPDTTETWLFKKNGGTDLVATIIIVYTDNTKSDIISVSKTPVVSI